MTRTPRLPLSNSLPPEFCGRSPVPSWQVREEGGEYDSSDQAEDENYEPEPEVFDAAAAHIEEQREVMCLLDDAENLLAVLIAVIEDDGDSRAMHIETVLKVVREKLREAHTRFDRQESHYRNLFQAYFAPKGAIGPGGGGIDATRRGTGSPLRQVDAPRSQRGRSSRVDDYHS